MKLNKTTLATLQRPVSGQHFVWDDDLRGFGLRLTATAMTWIVQKKRKGERTAPRYAIGGTDAWTPEQARAKAKELIRLIDDGFDPRTVREERISEFTFGELLEKYMLDYAEFPVKGKPRKRSAKLDRSRLTASSADWFDLPLSHITRALVSARHREITAKGYATGANRWAQTARAIWRWGRKEKHVKMENPFEELDLNEEYKRHGRIPNENLPKVWAAIQAEPSPYLRALPQVVLLTGARPEEVVRMRWERDWSDPDSSYIDLERGRWVKGRADVKTNEEQFLPLTPYLVELLATLPRKDVLKANGGRVPPNPMDWSEELRQTIPSFDMTFRIPEMEPDVREGYLNALEPYIVPGSGK